ncbi:hypothetical protein Cfor_02859 [Coptotermes formosanus]|jgi:hypothetical protein|uniref:Uncharacterized protein n=1 Tax=Coptotermes formosanus TaxID=36987 RepID=A0A6L2PAP0_COPFO|nr:hypothetical protein Cfor_02859 [Coptotermes formosanus]
MAQITKKTSRAPTVRVMPGDYTGNPLSLRRRLSLRLILGGLDVTPKPLVYEVQLPEDMQEALQTPPKAPHISEITGTASSLHLTRSTPLELTPIHEPFTESEMKNFVLFDESPMSGVSAEVPPLPSNLCYVLQPQEPGIPEYPLPRSNIVITLRETATVFHMNLPPLNVDVKTEEGKEVESDNEYYEYITVGKGCHRNTKMAEVQTEYSVRKTRSTMALTVGVKDSCASANAWDLYHSYKKLDCV